MANNEEEIRSQENKTAAKTDANKSFQKTIGASKKDLHEFAALFVEAPSLPCYHGSTALAFTKGSKENIKFRRCAQIWFWNCFIKGKGQDYYKADSWAKDVFRNDPEFPNFLLAISAETYLRNSNKFFQEWDITRMSVKVFSANILKFNQKSIDYNDFARRERVNGTIAGFLTCLHRSIPCGCLRQEKRRVQKCFKLTGSCAGCKAPLPVKKLKLCDGCKFVSYCGTGCQKKHWPSHKERCGKYLTP